MSQYRSLSAILLSGLVLYLGNGLQSMLLPIRGASEGFPTFVLGLLGSAYSVGFVCGCLAGPRVIRRVGHIRSFAVLAALAASAVLAHAVVVDPAAWLVLRGVSGLALAGLFMVVESWLNDQSTNETRGRVLSIYLIVNSGAVMVGQMLIASGDPEGFALFALAGIGICLAIVPVGLTTATGPAPVGQVRLRLVHLYRLSPVGMVGAFAVGLANGTFGTLGAVFMVGLGFDVLAAAAFVSAAMLGGTLVQFPAGLLSDRIDRRMVIAGFSVAASGIALAMWLSDGAGPVSGLIAVMGFGPEVVWISLAFLLGATAYPIYGVVAAHMNDFVPADGFVESSGGLLLIWGVGAAVGPFAGGLLMQATGSNTLFLFMAGSYASLAVFALYRATVRSAPAEKEAFVGFGVVRPTPAALELDPRAPDQDTPGETA